MRKFDDLDKWDKEFDGIQEKITISEDEKSKIFNQMNVMFDKRTSKTTGKKRSYQYKYYLSFAAVALILSILLAPMLQKVVEDNEYQALPSEEKLLFGDVTNMGVVEFIKVSWNEEDIYFYLNDADMVKVSDELQKLKITENEFAETLESAQPNQFLLTISFNSSEEIYSTVMVDVNGTVYIRNSFTTGEIPTSFISEGNKAFYELVGGIVEKQIQDEEEMGLEGLPPTALEAATTIIRALKNEDMATVAVWAHYEKGVRFSPYANVDMETDIVLTRNQLEGFMKDSTKRVWRTSSSLHQQIELTNEEYYKNYVYGVDFMNAEVALNQILGQDSSLENLTAVYPRESHDFVDYHIEAGPNGMGWRSLRLVFEKIGEDRALVGIIHDQPETNIKEDYLTKLNDIENSLTENSQAVTQLEMIQAQSEEFTQWDDALNEIYSALEIDYLRVK
ncbi:hypothetical protein DS745_06195 [Anaerobacillus alkaliphilus]|uniref:DUF4825 domain-containing protein n=1 Tax=Anaerobacillus alkaliphilus TaxID=1548597 RepID=A0A4Q0VVU7_9BACI|nr:lysozyme inhibitor LprI family protein [Anaerobacillus alkaliphilus]RXJ02559.1 hypothetical protein DS745_06195 [Anaerobacillus alkaliphilus]